MSSTSKWTGAPIMDPWPGSLIGAYLLVIDVAQPCSVVFGRYNSGRGIVVQSGQVLYIGSARGRPSQPRLAQRLLRHLTRSGEASPHGLRPALLAHFRQTADLAPPVQKRLRWHVDYLLDRPEAEVTRIWLARSNWVAEAELHAVLSATGHTAPVAPGLGAGDHPHATHLLYWLSTPQVLQQTLETLCRPEV